MEITQWALIFNGIGLALVGSILMFLLNSNASLNRRLGELVGQVSSMLTSHGEKVTAAIQKEGEICKVLSGRIDVLDRVVSDVSDEPFSSRSFAEGKTEILPRTSKIRTVLSGIKSS